MTKDLKVMDATAIAFCRDNKIPIVVFDMSKPGALRDIIAGGHVGTIIHDPVDSPAARCAPARPVHVLEHDGVVTLGRVIDETLLETIDKMDKAVAHVQSQFQTVRTGRAAPALVERLTVDYYGTQVPIVQLATIQVPEARQLLVRPHDRNTLAAIEKAIRDSDLGVAPGNDGSTIRLSFPPLDRGAPQGVRQDRQAPRRGGQGRRAQRAA